MNSEVEREWVVTEDGERLSAWVVGPEDGEPILLIAGGGSDGSSWRYMVSELFEADDEPLRLLAASPSLAGRHRVAGYAQRGTGASTGQLPPDSSRLAATHAAAVGRALLGPRFHVVGDSLGGMASQRLVIDQPALVSSAVLMATSAGGSGLTAPDEAYLANITGAGATEPRARAEENLALAFGQRFPRNHADLFARLVDQSLVQPSSSDSWMAQAQTFATHDTTAELAGVNVPTVVVVGSEDKIMPPPNSRYLADHIRDATYAEIGGAGHAIDIESASRVVELISSHVNANRIRPPAP